MSGLEEAGSGGIYLNVIDGMLRRTVKETTPKAVRRDWVSTDGKNKGTKWELLYAKLTGRLINIQYRTSQYGEQLSLQFQAGDDKFTVNMQSDSAYANNFLRRLPAVNLAEEFTIQPYDVTEGNKTNTGIKITQGLGDDGKPFTIKDFFFDGTNSINGIPVQDVASPTKDDWKVYFIRLKQFLKRVVEEKIQPKLLKILTEKPAPKSQSVAETSASMHGDPSAEFQDLPF